jgi:flagellar hook-basal body complex protein FliE
MSVQSVGLKAYSDALANFTRTEKEIRRTAPVREAPAARSFSDTFENSLAKVRDLQNEKTQAVESFASGETQNVHELMITLQKAGLAMNLTSAVRNKVLEAYRELSRMQF